MTKDVIVSISGLQMAESMDGEPIEVITHGDYYKRNGKHYILYEEVQEGFEGSTRSMIKLSENTLDITKKGVSNVHMLFEKNKKNLTYYYTPYGSLLIGIDAKNISVKEEEHKLHVEVDYALEVNYEHMADCTITMNIQSKESGDFRIA